MSTPISAITSPLNHASAQKHAKTQEKQDFASILSNTTQEIKKHEIMQKYDLHNISFDELNHMKRELLDAGAITLEEYFHINPFTSAIIDQHNGNPDWKTRKRDYIDEATQEFEFHKQFRFSDPQTYSSLEERVKIATQLNQASS